MIVERGGELDDLQGTMEWKETRAVEDCKKRGNETTQRNSKGKEGRKAMTPVSELEGRTVFLATD